MEKIGIIFYGRSKIFLLTIFCIWITFFILTFMQQSIGAYLNGEGFDTPVGEFLFITWFIFFPYLLVCSLILRSITARISFHRFVKNNVVVPEYSPSSVLSPAASGLLIDNEFHMSEVSATIMDLILKGFIEHEGAVFRRLINDESELSDVESAFLEEIFGSNKKFILNKQSALCFLNAGKNLADRTRVKLVNENQLNPKTKIYKTYRKFFYSLIVISLIVQLLLTTAFITSPNEVLSIEYPRYPMYLVQPISIILIMLIFVIIAISGFWQKAITLQEGIIKWRYVAGLRVYINKVYKGRFNDGDTLLVSNKEYKTFYPYSLALGIENEFTNEIENYLIQ